MCNAWNHSASCTCGWGGEGHLGKSSGHKGLNTLFTAIIYKTYSELLVGATFPNASCPVCGFKVFFYKSPQGGRVFFDELGPPWPKHPCTDNGREVRQIELRNLTKIETPIYKSTDGWQPFLCEDITYQKFDKEVAKITGIFVDIKKTFFLKQSGLTINSPFFIKIIDNNMSISTIVHLGKEIKAVDLRIFLYESDLHSLIPEVIKPRTLLIPIQHNDDKLTLRVDGKVVSSQVSTPEGLINQGKNKKKNKRPKKGSLPRGEKAKQTEKINIANSINNDQKLTHKMQEELKKYLELKNKSEIFEDLKKYLK